MVTYAVLFILMKVLANKQNINSFLVVWDNYGLVTLVNEDILTYFEVLFQHRLEGAEELNHVE
jgi:hypothetical protein